MPIRDAPDFRRRKRNVLAYAIENDKIIAETLHFREPQAAGHQGRGPNPRSNRTTGMRPLRANGSAVPSLSVIVPEMT